MPENSPSIPLLYSHMLCLAHKIPKLTISCINGQTRNKTEKEQKNGCRDRDEKQVPMTIRHLRAFFAVTSGNHGARIRLHLS
jgi:hypothetical protein